MKDHCRRAFRAALLLAAALALGACNKGANTPPDPVAATAVEASAEHFQQSLEGLWSTNHSEGDDAETLYAIAWRPDAGLQVVRDGAWLDGKVEDVDLDNGTLALHLTSDTGPSETVTLRKLQDQSGNGFTLRITWGAGQTDELGFVRRLTERDRSELAAAVAAARTPDPATVCETDAPAGSIRATLVCGHEEFGALDAGMRKQFKELADRYPDGDRTVQAATRQLDACDTPACLRAAYAQWQAYFDENYDLGDVVDYQ